MIKSVEEYFQQLRQAIEACSAVTNFQLFSEQRSDFEGFLKGEVTLKNGSILYFREFVNYIV